VCIPTLAFETPHCERPQRQTTTQATDGGSTRYFIPPPPIVPQPGRLPTTHASARLTSHFMLRVILRMTLLLHVDKTPREHDSSVVANIPRPELFVRGALDQRRPTESDRHRWCWYHARGLARSMTRPKCAGRRARWLGNSCRFRPYRVQCASATLCPWMAALLRSISLASAWNWRATFCWTAICSMSPKSSNPGAT